MKKTYLPAANLFAAPISWDKITTPIEELLESFYGPAITIIGALALLWALYVGMRWVAAGDDEEKKKKALGLVKNTITGVVIGGILLVALPFAITILSSWAQATTT